MAMKKTPLPYDAALKPFVRYCNIKKIALKPGEVIRTKTRADPWPSLVVSIGSPIYRGKNGRTLAPIPKVAAFGVGELPGEVEFRPGHSHLTFSFYPGRAHPFFGTTLREFTDRATPLSEVWGARGREIEERIDEARSVSEIKNIIEAELLRRLPQTHEYPAGVVEALKLGMGSAGRTSVKDMAAAAGCSAVHLKRLFTQWVGLTPKVFSRIVRFQGLCASLTPAEKPQWAGLSYDTGYSHQSHMIRDFLDFAGETPTQFYDSVVIPASLPNSPLKAFQPDPTFHA